MLPAPVYHPIWFYAIVLLATFALCPLAMYFSRRKGLEKFQLPLMFLGLSVPCITALIMIYTTSDGMLIADFWKRLLLFEIPIPYLLFILLLMPCVIGLATWKSLFFGYSTEQFHVTKEMSIMKGWAFFGIAIPLFFAPLIEELGWRGYGIDSLRAYFNLFNASMLFGLLWAAWHVPTFFVKGYYQHELWNLGIPYVINFFVSTFIVALLMNWVYYKTGRSIPAMVLFHAMLNFSSMILRTEQFTKCIATVLLGIVSVIVVFCDRDYFFSNTSLVIN